MLECASVGIIFSLCTCASCPEMYRVLVDIAEIVVTSCGGVDIRTHVTRNPNLIARPRTIAQRT